MPLNDSEAALKAARAKTRMAAVLRGHVPMVQLLLKAVVARIKIDPKVVVLHLAIQRRCLPASIPMAMVRSRWKRPLSEPKKLSRRHSAEPAKTRTDR